ncbi:MAG: molecular chaperone HtpG [Candidatus Sumerlaeia bacterium]|nr:molecular chaperone HtpG [Candidatus Sumerlaeia bacterium]
MTAAATPETHVFQAEVRQILDIVTHSIYTDRDVFVRELVSNAADALEKFRHAAVTAGDDVADPGAGLEITLETDDAAKLFIIRDTGIGMTREELMAGLGTIAHSGTRSFLAQLAEEARRDVSVIGKFGVGFYSAFMVAQKVTVETRSYRPDAPGYLWESTGDGSFTIEERGDLPRGTRITLHLKEDAEEFARASTIRAIVKRYSSFVPFPIHLGGEVVNTQQALWAKAPKDVSADEHREFYKYLHGSGDEPLLTLHFRSDSPIDLKALLYVPKENVERLGFGKMSPGTDLYCRKVLIEKHPENLLPEWLRFVRGVVDSEDLPLNLSRESMQDSALLRRINSAVTGRFLRFLAETAKDEPARYAEFYDSFGVFLKEGLANDFAHRDQLAKLLRFRTTRTGADERIGLDEYVARMPEGQKDIYFLSLPEGIAPETNPYLEAFRAKGYEVLLTSDAGDDFVLANLGQYEGKGLLSADSPLVKFDDVAGEGEALSDDDAKALCGWLKTSLGDRVGSVRSSARLVDSPAMVVGDGMMTNAMRRVMTAMGRSAGAPLGSLTLEINPRHAIVRQLHALRAQDEAFAKALAEQLLDSTLLGAGLLTDVGAMVARMQELMLRASKRD